MLPITMKIDESFFEEETRSGFFVPRERKELWAIEIDLLNKLDSVCRKHGLRYCVGAGTLLGTIRHQGFIPWDDDVDVYMLREDYDRLMELSDEFEEPYFLQNSYTEENLLRTYTRLRNSRTTGTTKMDQHRLINKGLFIDICPIDGITEDRMTDRIQLLKNTLQRKLFECFNAVRTPRHEEPLSKRLKYPVKKLLYILFAHNKEKLYEAFNKNISRFSVEGTELWGNRSLTFECPRTRRPYGDWTDLVYMPFEFIEVPVPRKYDEMLRQQYGDYMKIPEHIGENMHGEMIISTEFSYDELKEKLL